MLGVHLPHAFEFFVATGSLHVHISTSVGKEEGLKLEK